MNNLQIIEHQNQRVLLTSQLAESYGTTTNRIKNNFMENKNRYKEGKHYFLLKGDELKAFKLSPNSDLVDKRTPSLYLWTERGAFLHAKSLQTDKAWEVYDSLVEHYFQSREAKPSLLPTSYKEALLQLVSQVEENERLELENKMKDQQIGELKPKADYYDQILKSKSLVTISQIAKDYGMGAPSFNKKLHELGVQYKLGRQWLLYHKYQDKGYTSSETVNITHNDGREDVVMNTKWTQKGRLFSYELLKNNNILPTIERED